MNSENLLLKFIRAGIILALFTPLVLGPFGLSFSEYPKALYFRIVVGITVMLWMVLLWLNPKYLPKISILTSSVLLFMVVLLVSSLFGFNFSRSFWGGLETGGGLFNMLHFAAFYLVLISVFGTTRSSASGIQGRFRTRAAMVPPKAESEGLNASERAEGRRASDPETTSPNGADWLFLLRWVVFVSFLSILAGFLQKMGLAGFYGVSLSAGRISGTLSNPVYFGAYLVMTIFLAFYLLLVEQKKDWKIIWSVVAALGFTALLMSGVRGAFAGFMFSLGVLAVLTFFFIITPSYPKIRRWVLGLALASSVALLLVVLFVPINFLASGSGLERITAIFDPEAIKGRLPGWETAISAWKDKPLLGWGYSSFGYLYDKYFSPHYYNYIHGYYVFLDAHGKILNLLAEAGILGAASYLLIFGVVFYALFQQLKPGNTELRDHPEENSYGASDFAEGKAVPVGASERAEDLSERARWASERVPQSVFSSIILISLFAGYFFQNMFAFDTVSTYVVFFFLLAFVNNNYSNGFPRIVYRFPRITDKKFFQIASKIFTAAAILFMLWLMYFGNINPALSSYDFVRGVVLEQEDYAGSIWHYRKALERNMPYRRELLFMAASRDVRAIQGDIGRDEEKRQLIAADLAELTPQMMRYFGQPDIRYLNFQEVLASSGEWQYLMTQDEKALETAYQSIEKALELNDKWMQFYYLLGRLEVYQRNYEKAEEYFDKAFQLSRGDFTDRFYRYKTSGTAYARTKEYKTAAEHFLQAVEAMYVHLKNVAVSSSIPEDLERKRKTTQGDVSVFELTAWLHWQLGDKETALEVYQKALEVYPEHEIRLKKDLEKMKSQ